jgi:sirohydrochlorin cobaltochelatase
MLGVSELSANDALLLIGHGSARYPDAGTALHRHAGALRAMGRFSQVEVALLHGGPSVQRALALIDAGTIRVVPFFMEDGYFSRVAIPRALGISVAATDDSLPVESGSPRFMLCPPIGVHDGLAGLIERHALAACETSQISSRAAAVVVVGHGSSSSPGRALALHRHTSRVAATELFARVEAACLEEPPLVADTLRALRAHPVVAVGFFANDGSHMLDDVPALIAAEQAARSDEAGLAVQCIGSIAGDPAMVQIIMDQAQGGVNDPVGG